MPSLRIREKVESATFDRNGTLWTFTTQQFIPKSPPYVLVETDETFEPYAVGYVEFADQARIEGRIVDCALDDLRIGAEMETVVVPFMVDDQGLVRSSPTCSSAGGLTDGGQMDVAIIGIGIHPFGRFDDLSALDMGVTAARQALSDAGVAWGDVEFAVGGSLGSTQGTSAAPDAMVLRPRTDRCSVREREQRLRDGGHCALDGVHEHPGRRARPRPRRRLRQAPTGCVRSRSGADGASASGTATPA